VSRVVHLVVPEAVDDLRRPSGGNTYDRRLSRGLGELGWTVHEHPLAGSWPRPAAADLDALAAVLDRVPENYPVILDGLIASAASGVLLPRSGTVRIVVLVHMLFGPVEPACAGEADVLRSVHAVVVTSDWTRRRLRETLGEADRVHVVPPGTDRAPATTPHSDGERLLCVAAVTPVKGHDLLLAALEQLDHAGWRCRCIGSTGIDPGFATTLRERIHRAGLADRMELTGPLTGADLDLAYADSDLLVLPSRQESYGMVVTEALARGLPVIAADVGGVPEALGHDPAGERPGILVPADDVDALAAALRAWLDDELLRRQLRSAARGRRASLPGWDEAAARIARLLTALLPHPCPYQRPEPRPHQG